jgi:nucleoside-diphosphate-sugar epimerase
MRVLITGGAGFIGQHLVASQLAQGHAVRAVDLRPALDLPPSPRLEFIQGDLRDAALVERLAAGIDVLYHLASAHLDVRLPASHYWETNVAATAALLRAARAAGVRRVVHCSSVGVLGDVARPPADERSPTQPTNLYEKTKLAGEAAALEFGAQSGLPVAVARPAWVYGPGCPRTAKLLRSIHAGRFVIFGSGRTLRHPIYVADAVRGLERCAEAARAGEVYILAGERALSVAALAAAAAEVVGVPPPRLRLPAALGRLAALGVELACRPLRLSPPFSRRSLDFFCKQNAYDTRKARQDLGFVPQVDLPAGLAAAWDWVQAASAARAAAGGQRAQAAAKARLTGTRS